MAFCRGKAIYFWILQIFVWGAGVLWGVEALSADGMDSIYPMIMFIWLGVYVLWIILHYVIWFWLCPHASLAGKVKRGILFWKTHNPDVLNEQSLRIKIVLYVSLIEDLAILGIVIYTWKTIEKFEFTLDLWWYFPVIVLAAILWICKVCLFIWSKLKNWVAHMLLKYYCADEYKGSDVKSDCKEKFLLFFYFANALFNLGTKYWYSLQELSEQAKEQAESTINSGMKSADIAAFICLVQSILETIWRFFAALYKLGRTKDDSSGYLRMDDGGGNCCCCLTAYANCVDGIKERWSGFLNGPFAKYIPILEQIPQLVNSIIVQLAQDGKNLSTLLSIIASSVVLFLRLNVYIIFDYIANKYMGPLKNRAKIYLKAKKAALRGQKLRRMVGFCQ